MVYDCFTFFHELDLLDLRLEIMNATVDRFVLVESTVTFSGKDKYLFFKNNRERYSKYLDKIIHVVVDDTPDDFINLPHITQISSHHDREKNRIYKVIENFQGWNKNEKQWGREIYQREAVFFGLSNCKDDDIIILSDLDEIPNPEEIENIRDNNNKGIYDFKQNTYYYYLNLLKEVNWSGSKCLRWYDLKDKSINYIRQNKYTTDIIDKGGWHFSFMGGPEMIRMKIDAYSHQEYNNSHIISNIENNIQGEIDPFFRSKLTRVNIDDSFPKQITSNLSKYSNYIKK